MTGMNKSTDSNSREEFLARVQAVHQCLGIPANFLSESRLPLCVEPPLLVATEDDFYGRPQRLTPAAHDAWATMRASAAAAGVEIHLISAFRDIEYQQQLIARKIDRGQKIEEILKVNAAPGFSEHHTGRAIDIGTPGCDALAEEFENTEAFQWLSENAGEFGFVLSYPRNNVLGISYEPWHWCYKNPDEA